MKTLGCLALVLLVAYPIRAEDAPAAQARVSAFVSILPQQYFVERIGGERVAVEVLVRPGQSPVTYDPTARQMAALAKADVYFCIGVLFEQRLLAKIKRTVPELRCVDTQAELPLRRMRGRHAHAHDTVERPAPGTDKKPDAPANRAGLDPHVWLNPKLAIGLAESIATTLTELDPDGRKVYAANLATLRKDLRALDARLAKTLAPLKGGQFFVYHPAWGYFADAYGLKQVPIELEGKAPSIKYLAELIELANQRNIGVIFVQPQFDNKAATALANAVGGTVVAIDPLAGDYIANLERAGEAIAQGARR